MSLPSIPTVCRTVVVLAFLLALAVAGRPGWASVVPALALVAVWVAPLVVRHRRRAVVAVADPAPAEAPAA